VYVISAKIDEDYSHYFITCTFLNEFWKKCQNLMKELGVSTPKLL
jgi:hypothetical protein